MNINIFEIVYSVRMVIQIMELGLRVQVLFFIIYVYFDVFGDIKFDNILNLIICIYIYVVCMKYNYIFLNLMNFDFEKKV